MADFEVNFTLDPQPEIEADFNIEVGGVTEHNLLSNRDLPDQHPISAITGLQEALDTIPTDYVSDAELEAALLEKQDVIRDLSEIRQGATLGATAVQPSELESYATKDYVDDGLSGKQDTLTAGANIQITGNTISATDTTYTAGTGISIENGVISNTQTSAEWGNISGTLSNQTDLDNALNNLSGGIDSNHQAISSINQTISTYGNIVTHSTSEFATSSQGALADTAIQPNDNISELTNNVGYITGITSSDVTTALGYTPYNSSNPSGYTSNVGTVTSVNSTSPDGNGNVTLSIPAAQVNSDWNANSGVAQILNKPTIPTVNDATITITQGGVTKGSFTLNQASGDTIALDAGGGGGGGSYTAGDGIDITNDVISVTAPTLTNTATGSDSVTILGIANSNNKAVNIGIQSQGGYYTTSVGYGAVCSGTTSISIGYLTNVTAASATSVGTQSEVSADFGIAIGRFAKVTASSAIQIGYGTNSEANSFYVSTSDSNNWKMLGSDGKIPSGRLPIATSVSSSSTNSETVGAKLFYDTCGDIETLINAL